jgi:O-antigen/teichoic acid export membrane protein
MSATKKSKIYQLVLVLIFSMIGYVCNIAATKIMTAHLSLSLYGDFSVAWNSLSLVSQIILFGSSLSIKRYLSEYHSDNSVHKKRSFIRWNLALLFRIFMVMLAFYAMFWAIAWVAHLQNMHNFEKYHLAFFVCIFGVLLSLWTVFASYILSFGYTTLFSFLGSAGWSGIQLFVIGVGFYFFLPSTEMHLSFLIIALLFVLLAVNMLIFSMLPGNELFNISYISPPPSSQDKEQTSSFHDPAWLSVSQGNMINGLCFVLTGLGPLYLLEFLSPNEHHVAIYNIGLIITGFFQLLMLSMYRLSSAAITTINQYNADERRNLQYSVNCAVAVCSFLFVLGLILFDIFGVPIFGFFHIPDTHLTGILLLLLCNTFTSNLSFLSSTYLQANGDANFCFSVRLVAMFIVYVLGAFMCLYYDIYGVVISCLIASLVQYIAFTYRARQLTSFKFSGIF